MKRRSLKDKLLDLINQEGYVSYGFMCQYTAEAGYKVSTAERRLRQLASNKDENGNYKEPQIDLETKTSRRKTTYISGYTRLGVEKPKPTIQIVEENGERIAKLIV